MAENQDNLSLKYEDVDLTDLFPGETIQFGNKSIYVQPLGIDDLVKHTKILGQILKEAINKGIKTDNWSDPENLTAIVNILVDSGLPLISTASGIDIRILQVTPPLILCKLINDILDVNIDNLGGFEKNLKALAERVKSGILDNLQKVTGLINLMDLFAGESLPDLSAKDIVSEISEDTPQAN